MLDLARDVGVADQLVPTSDLLGLVRDGTVHRIHSRARLDAVRTGLLSPRAKLGAATLIVDTLRARDKLDWNDLSRAAEYDRETVEEYGRRRLSPEVVEYLADPLTRTVYLSNIDEVSVVDLLFAIGRFFGGSFMNSPRGMGFLCQGIADLLDVRLGARATAVEERPGGVRVTYQCADGEVTEDADACVIALSAI